MLRQLYDLTYNGFTFIRLSLYIYIYIIFILVYYVAEVYTIFFVFSCCTVEETVCSVASTGQL